MLTITFKNVGQGDSVICEFKTRRKSTIGVIDCKKIGNENPVVNHLKKLKSKEILFLVLSHPHIDHYSGFLELLEYIEEERYSVKKFIHSSNVHPSYLNWVELSSSDKQLLRKIFHKIIVLEKSGIIQSIEIAVKNYNISLNSKTKLTCISPSDNELRTFTKRVDLFKNTNESKCSRAANLLSTIFKISRNNKFALFTSDAEKETFVRLNLAKNRNEYFKSSLVISQVPHHGAEKNHHKPFWKNLDYFSQCPAVVSAGKNTKYNHPQFKVVKDFYDLDFSIQSTNNVNGMEELNTLLKAQKTSLILDMDSVLIEEYNQEGEKVFKLDKDFSVT